MAQMPEPQNTTRSLIVKFWEDNAELGFREHLGASIIGRACSRDIWYSFRWVTPSKFPGRILRLFNRGQREEAVFISELKGIGVDVQEVDPRTGEQWQYSTLGGHFGGSGDGIAVSGVIEAPKSPHILEFKTHNDKSFKQLVKEGVLKAKPEHYAQMQVYMGLSKIDRALYGAVNKNDDDQYFERIEADKADFDKLIARAEMIITSDKPPAKISEDPGWYQCNFCDHRSTCHSTVVPPPTCRSCIHSTPKLDGNARWHCDLHDVDMNKEQQLEGCGSHTYNPSLVENWATATDAFDDNIEFTVKSTGNRFLNGPPREDGLAVYSSVEIFKAEDKALIGNKFVDSLKNEFGDATLQPAGPDVGDGENIY